MTDAGAARLLLTGGVVVTLNARREILAPGAVIIEGPRIAYAGPAGRAPVRDDDDRIDCRSHLVMPGLVNAHTHAAMGMFRGLAEDRPRDEWARTMYALPYLDRLRPDEYRHGAFLGALEMLSNGITATADRGSFMEFSADGLDAAGIRAVVSHTLFDVDRPLELDRALALVNRWGTDPESRVHCGLGPHAPDTCSDALLRRVRALAGETGARVFVHCAQSDREIAALRGRGHRGAVRCLWDAGLLGADVVAAHCVYVDDEEIQLLADTGTWVAHCPASNAKIEGRAAPVASMLRAGVGVALGTDWAPSNNGMDLFDEMKTAVLLGKVRSDDAAALPAGRLLEMATVDGARALGIDAHAGSLEAGKRADVIVVALDALRLEPLHDPAAALAYTVKGQDVRHVWVDGRWLIRDRRPTHVDVDALRAETERVWRRLRGSFRGRA